VYNRIITSCKIKKILFAYCIRDNEKEPYEKIKKEENGG